MSEDVLDLDLGNTRLKWRYSSCGKVIEEGAAAWGSTDEIPVDAPRLDRIRVASVVASARLEALVRSCRERWQVEVELARVIRERAGVRQGYRDESRLGVDRWLALLAAHHTTDSDCVVVSCGTAVTVDLLTRLGDHLGGYIVPGFEMMRSSLFAGTNAVKLEKLKPPNSLSPGRDTIPAVTHGLILMIKSLVEKAAADLNSAAADLNIAAAGLTNSAGGGPTLVVTGGDGELLAPFLGAGASTNVLYRPNLVLDGLALALP